MKKLCLLSFLLCSFSVFSQIEEPAEDEVFIVVEDMPVYRGCEHLDGSSDEKEKAQCTQGKITDYLAANARYSDESKDRNQSETWFLTYVVNEKAEVEQVKILRYPPFSNREMEEESIRLVKSLEFAEPGRQRGKAVKVQFSAPIKFRTDEEFSNLVRKVYGPKFLEGKRGAVAPGCEEFVGEEEQLKSCSLEYIERFVQENAEVPGIVQEMDLRLPSVVTFTIGKDGSVEEAEIKKSAQDFVNSSSEEEVEAAEAADKAALDVVKKLKFTIPEQNKGEPGKLTCQVPVVFISN